jgi:hypothetical protein
MNDSGAILGGRDAVLSCDSAQELAGKMAGMIPQDRPASNEEGFSKSRLHQRTFAANPAGKPGADAPRNEIGVREEKAKG